MTLDDITNPSKLLTLIESWTQSPDNAGKRASAWYANLSETDQNVVLRILFEEGDFKEVIIMEDNCYKINASPSRVFYATFSGALPAVALGDIEIEVDLIDSDANPTGVRKKIRIQRVNSVDGHVDHKDAPESGGQYWLMEGDSRKERLLLQQSDHLQIITKDTDFMIELDAWFEQNQCKLSTYIEQKNYRAIIQKIKEGYDFSLDELVQIMHLSSVENVVDQAGARRKIRTFLHELLNRDTGIAESKHCVSFLGKASLALGIDKFEAIAKQTNGVAIAAQLFTTPDLQSILTKNLRSAIIASESNTHLSSINFSAETSIQKLYTRFQARYSAQVPVSTSDEKGRVAITRNDVFTGFINQKITEFFTKLDLWSHFSDDKVRAILASANNKQTGQVSEDDITRFKFELCVAKRYIEGCQSGRIDGIGRHEVHFNDHKHISGLTLKEVTAIVFDALSDDGNLSFTDESDEEQKSHDRNAHFIKLVAQLFQIRRENNGDNKYEERDTDNWICTAGTMNSLVCSLEGVHKDVKFAYLTSEIVAKRIEDALGNHLEQYLGTLTKEERVKCQTEIVGHIAQAQSVLSSGAAKFDQICKTVTLQIKEEFGDFIPESLMPEWVSKGLEAARNNTLAIREFYAIYMESVSAKAIYEVMCAKRLPLYLLTKQGYVPLIKSFNETKLTELQDYVNTLTEINLRVIGNYNLKLPEMSGQKVDRGVLIWAVVNRNIEIVNWLFRLPEQVVKQMLTFTNATKMGALHFAAILGYKEIVTALIEQEPSLVASRDANGNTPLHLAVENGRQAQAVVELLAKNILWMQNEEGNTALHLALKKRNTEIAQLLIKQAPSLIRARNLNGDTALHLAVEERNTEIVQLLIKQDSSLILVQDIKGNTALHLALGDEEAEESLALLLIENMTAEELIVTDNAGYTALHVALINSKKECVKALLNKVSKDAFKKYFDGVTDLHFLIDRADQYEASLVNKIVLDNLEIKTQDGDTLLHYVINNWEVNTNTSSLATLLIENMTIAQLQTEGKGGYTALQLINASEEEDIKSLSTFIQGRLAQSSIAAGEDVEMLAVQAVQKRDRQDGFAGQGVVSDSDADEDQEFAPRPSQRRRVESDGKDNDQGERAADVRGFAEQLRARVDTDVKNTTRGR